MRFLKKDPKIPNNASIYAQHARDSCMKPEVTAIQKG